jgi:hypothetical protein
VRAPLPYARFSGQTLTPRFAGSGARCVHLWRPIPPGAWWNRWRGSVHLTNHEWASDGGDVRSAGDEAAQWLG